MPYYNYPLLLLFHVYTDRLKGFSDKDLFFTQGCLQRHITLWISAFLESLLQMSGMQAAALVSANLKKCHSDEPSEKCMTACASFLPLHYHIEPVNFSLTYHLNLEWLEGSYFASYYKLILKSFEIFKNTHGGVSSLWQGQVVKEFKMSKCY